MLAGLREAKLSRSKRIKVRYFPGGKTEDLQYHLFPYLKKELDNIIIHIGTNDSSYKTEDFIYKESVNIKETITKVHPNCKNIVISSPIVRTNKKEVIITYLKIRQHFEIGRKEFHFSQQHFRIAFTQGWSALKFRWYNYASWKSFIKDTIRTNLSNDHNSNNIINSSDYKSLINDNSSTQLGSVKSFLKRFCSNHPQQIIIGNLNISSFKNKFDIMKPMLRHDIDTFMVTDTKLNDSFPVSQFNVEGFSTPFRLD